MLDGSVKEEQAAQRNQMVLLVVSANKDTIAQQVLLKKLHV
jgi:hypothetical protein